MKNIDHYILEKLNVKNIDIKYDVDDLINQNELLYSDNDEYNDCWNECKEEIKNISIKYYKKIGGYIITPTKLSKLNPDSLENKIDIYEDIEDAIDTICTGKDMGYEIYLRGGHFEIDVINSGSRSTYYIYGIESTAWDHLSAWWEGDDDIKSLSFIFAEGSIIPIEYN